MTSYAENTKVSVRQSRIEIEELLVKWKATRSATMLEPDRAVVYFQMGQWHVQFSMPLPTDADARKQTNSRGWLLGEIARQKWLEQELRSKWRALLLTIKAKLVSVENGVETFEEAFLAHLVLPSGETVGQKALPAITEAVKTGRHPMILGPGVVPPTTS